MGHVRLGDGSTGELRAVELQFSVAAVKSRPILPKCFPRETFVRSGRKSYKAEDGGALYSC
jgi:hypothetical protein